MRLQSKVRFGVKPVVGVAIACLSWVTCISAQAEELPFAAPLMNMERLREAEQAVHGHSAIRAFLKNTGAQLAVSDRVVGAGVETTKFQAYFKGLEVVGSLAMHHRGPGGKSVSNFTAAFDLDPTPVLSQDEARHLTQARLTGALPATVRLKILPLDTGGARLVYWVSADGTLEHPGADVVVDARTGQVIADISHHYELADVQVYQANDRCQRLNIDGRPTGLNVSACDQAVKASVTLPAADDSAKRALGNATKVLSYFQRSHGRDSYNDGGAEIVNVVHVGRKFVNAFWSSDLKLMGYGDGDGVETGDFTRAVDVAGHEMTHGVISETAKLVYMGESGALNEAFADFFGKMIANDGDWSIGRGIYLDAATAKGFRNLADPHQNSASFKKPDGTREKRPFPAHVSEQFPAQETCDSTNDRCWVHVNSTIPGHASYRVFEALGKEKSEQIYYLALTQFVGAKATFREARNGIVKACGQLYASSDCEQVEEAFAAVGL